MQARRRNYKVASDVGAYCLRSVSITLRKSRAWSGLLCLWWVIKSPPGKPFGIDGVAFKLRNGDEQRGGSNHKRHEQGVAFR